MAICENLEDVTGCGDYRGSKVIVKLFKVSERVMNGRLEELGEQQMLSSF